MTQTVSYEVLSTRGENWTIESIYDDRDVALYEARVLLENRHVRGVKVIQESYDDETDKTSLRTIFNEEKGVAKVQPKPTKKEPVRETLPGSAPPRKKKETDFIKYLIVLVLSIGGILLAVLALGAFLVGAFGNG